LDYPPTTEPDSRAIIISLFQCPLHFYSLLVFPLQLHISWAVFLSRIDMAFISNDSRNVYHINCVDCKFRPLSLRNFLYFFLTFVYRGPNILPNTLLSITLSLYSNLGINNLLKKDAVPYQNSAKVSLLLPLLLIYLAIRWNIVLKNFTFYNTQKKIKLITPKCFNLYFLR
jgi:hypothetical protein